MQRILILLFFFNFSSFAYAAWFGPPLPQADGEPEFDLSLLDQADQSQKKLSRELHRLSHQIDSFFANNRIDNESKSKSRIRLNLLSNFREGMSDKYAFNIRTRLALANTEKKLNLVLQNFSKNFTEDHETNKETLAQTVEKDNFAAGILYQPETPKEWNFSTDLGMKIAIPLDPYARLRVRRTWWPGNWEIRATTTPFWFKLEGLGHTETLEFDRPLSERFLFRWDNSASWLDSDFMYHFSHSLNLFHQWNDDLALVHFFRLASSDHHNPHVDEYTIGVNYRRRLKGNWFFFNLQPTANWPRNKNFKFIPALDLKLEIVIGE